MNTNDRYPFDEISEAVREAAGDVLRPLVDDGLLSCSLYDVSELARSIELRFAELLPVREPGS